VFGLCGAAILVLGTVISAGLLILATVRFGYSTEGVTDFGLGLLPTGPVTVLGLVALIIASLIAGLPVPRSSVPQSLSRTGITS